MRAGFPARQQFVGVFVGSLDNEIHGRKKARKERAVEFTDWLWFKFIALCVAAFVWNFWMAFTGRK